jgi:hypothetical protein
MKKILEVVKTVGGIVISIGVGAVAANLIKATTPEDVKKITKICIGVGSFFVASLAASVAGEKFESTVDRIVNIITKFMEHNKTGEEVVKTEA